MPSTLVDEVLEVWKEGEQLLPDLQPLSPDHETVRVCVSDLRAAYVSLVSRGQSSGDNVERSRLAIDRARRSIEDVARRTNRSNR